MQREQSTHMWKTLNSKPEDDRTYLVSYKQADGSFASPHRAYYLEDEDKFFSLENNNSHPIVVDIYIEIPQMPATWANGCKADLQDGNIRQ